MECVVGEWENILLFIQNMTSNDMTKGVCVTDFYQNLAVREGPDMMRQWLHHNWIGQREGIRGKKEGKERSQKRKGRGGEIWEVRG